MGEASDAATQDIATEDLKLSEKEKLLKSSGDADLEKNVQQSQELPATTRPYETNARKSHEETTLYARQTSKRSLRKLKKDEDEEDIMEETWFVIDESKSTSSSKYVIRKRKSTYKTQGKITNVEYYEDSFTIPFHKFNMNLILMQTKIENIEETVIVQRSIFRQKIIGEEIEVEELSIPTDHINLENVLPMIDHSQICDIRIVESRKQLVRKKSRIIKSLNSAKGKRKK